MAFPYPEEDPAQTALGLALRAPDPYGGQMVNAGDIGAPPTQAGPAFVPYGQPQSIDQIAAEHPLLTALRAHVSPAVAAKLPALPAQAPRRAPGGIQSPAFPAGIPGSDSTSTRQSYSVSGPTGDIPGAVEALKEQGAIKQAAGRATGDAIAGQEGARLEGANQQADQAAQNEADLAAANAAGDAHLEKARARHDEALAKFQGAGLRGYWADRSTGEKLGTALFQAIGAIGAGLAHGPNYALDILNKDIDRDTNLQLHRVEQLKDSEAMTLAGVRDAVQAKHQLVEDAHLRSASANETIAKRIQARLVETGASVEQAKNDERVVAFMDKAIEDQLKAAETTGRFATSLAAAEARRRHAGRGAGSGGGGGGAADPSALLGPNGEVLATLPGNPKYTAPRAKEANKGVEQYRNMRGLGEGLKKSLSKQMSGPAGLLAQGGNMLGIESDNGAVLAQRDQDVKRIIAYVNTAADQGVINAGDQQRVEGQLVPYKALLIKGGPQAEAQMQHFLDVLDDAVKRKLASHGYDANALLPAIRGDAGAIAPGAQSAGKTAAIVRPVAAQPAASAPGPAAITPEVDARALAWAKAHLGDPDEGKRAKAAAIFQTNGARP